MIDNFKQISSLLEFRSEDDFYFLQLIKRKKEHPELGSNSHVIKTYYINSVEYLEVCKREIIYFCNFHNARAYINLNRRSFEKCAFHTLQKVTNIIMNRDYKSVRSAYDSVCGVHSNESDKTWVIDIDTKDNKEIDKIVRVIEYCNPQKGKIVAYINTKNGIHIITNPFNLQQFKEKCSDIEIHKNNPTILFIP